MRLRKVKCPRSHGWSQQSRTMNFCLQFLSAILLPLLRQLTFCGFQGIFDMRNIIQILSEVKYMLLTNEETEFQSICITSQDNRAHK